MFFSVLVCVFNQPNCTPFQMSTASEEGSFPDMVLLLLPFLTIDQIFDHYCHFGVAQGSQEDMLISSHQSLNREGRWGTTDDFATSFLHFPCSPLPSGTCRTPGLSIPCCCLRTSSSVCLVFFPLSLCLAPWGCAKKEHN